MQRRTFLKTAAAAAAAVAVDPRGALAAQAAPRVRFGVDLFSINRQGWSASQMLEWAAKWKINVVHFSEIGHLGGLEPDNLRRVRAQADSLGLELEVGMRSICPSSTSFDAAQGTAEAQLGRMVDVAKSLRSPIVRCFLGTSADRRSAGGIDARIDDMVKVLKNSRSRVMDAGVKVAIENHAGDMQARELKRLVESSGPEFVGVTIDSGNPVWTIEDPHLTLETLAPYVLTSHIRDSAVWMTPQGIAAQWTRVGEGTIGIGDYIRTYVQKCPGKAVSLEVIVSNAPRMFNYRDPAAWELYKNTPAHEFARFLALAEKGKAPAPAAPLPPAPPPPAGAAPAAAAGGRGGNNPAAIARQLEDCEASIRWTQAFLATL
jgi:sugar phosphate isomerase/epimerase